MNNKEGGKFFNYVYRFIWNSNFAGNATIWGLNKDRFQKSPKSLLMTIEKLIQ